eukprot:Skav200474  [mRNA]  locus=scaffold5182:180119:190149:- [translate_table: standard]
MRTLAMIFFCLVMRNSLKLVFLSYGIQASSPDAVHHAATAGSEFNVNQLGVVLLLIALAASVMGGCAAIINSTSDLTFGDALSANTDVFMYMYVLDFLVDLLTPYLGKESLRGTWTIGFFGRWLTERNEFESAKSKNQKFSWSSLGAEVFGVRAGRGRPPAAPPAPAGGSYMVPSGKVQSNTVTTPPEKTG